mmetsp:Transcript_17293/g.70212  ORF Transcript_17293/g.70212 Transcript_17293/m.70212 type:complete len:247 (-) Transcript_17293:284-1024(-)
MTAGTELVQARCATHRLKPNPLSKGLRNRFSLVPRVSRKHFLVLVSLLLSPLLNVLLDLALALKLIVLGFQFHSVQFTLRGKEGRFAALNFFSLLPSYPVPDFSPGPLSLRTFHSCIERLQLLFHYSPHRRIFLLGHFFHESRLLLFLQLINKPVSFVMQSLVEVSAVFLKPRIYRLSPSNSVIGTHAATSKRQGSVTNRFLFRNNSLSSFANFFKRPFFSNGMCLCAQPLLVTPVSPSGVLHTLS